MEATEIEYADCSHIGFITKQGTNNRSWGRVSVDVENLRSLLVISNKYSYLIAGTQTGNFHLFFLISGFSFINKTSNIYSEQPQIDGIKNVVTPGKVRHLALSCDELQLAVLLEDRVLLYRICDLLYNVLFNSSRCPSHF